MRPSRNNNYQLLALIAAAAGILLLALGGYLSPLFNGAIDPIYGVQGWLYTRFQAIQDFINAPVNIASLRAENAQLRAENAQLQTEIVTLQQQVTEGELLSALLDFARAR